MTVPSRAPPGVLDAGGGAAILERLGIDSSVFHGVCPLEGPHLAPVVPPFLALRTEFKGQPTETASDGSRQWPCVSRTYVVVNGGPVGVLLRVQLLLLLGHHVVFGLLLFAHRPPLRAKGTRDGQDSQPCSEAPTSIIRIN